MPTYEYVCEKCDHQFELFQSINDKPLTICPKEKCGRKVWGKGKVRRAISAGAGLIFKGSGFYITDYRSEGYKEAAKKESSAGKESSKESGGTKEGSAGKEGGGGSKESSTSKPKETKASKKKE